MKYKDCLNKCIAHAKLCYSVNDFVKVKAMYQSYPKPDKTEWEPCIYVGDTYPFYYSDSDETPITSPNFLVYMGLYELFLYKKNIQTVSAKKIMDTVFDSLLKKDIHIAFVSIFMADLFGKQYSVPDANFSDCPNGQFHLIRMK